MTKDELLALLGSLNLESAGAAASYVESLGRDDPRFQGSFLWTPLSTLGYWLEQKKIASEGGFSPSVLARSIIGKQGQGTDKLKINKTRLDAIDCSLGYEYCLWN